MASKKKSVIVAGNGINDPVPGDNRPVADISEQEMIDSEMLRLLNAKLRAAHGINLAEALNDLLRRFGHGVNLRD